MSVSTADFEHFEAQEKQHIIISVKDFKSIVNHAGLLNANIHAYYSNPGRPLQFFYTQEGLTCQFTLMTAGDYSGTPATSAPVSAAPTQPASRDQSIVSPAAEISRPKAKDMPPPAEQNKRKSLRKLGQNESHGQITSQQRAKEVSESLFVPMEEEDHRWDPTEYEEDEETLGWDTNVSNVGFILVP